MTEHAISIYTVNEIEYGTVVMRYRAQCALHDWKGDVVDDWSDAEDSADQHRVDSAQTDQEALIEIRSISRTPDGPSLKLVRIQQVLDRVFGIVVNEPLFERGKATE